LFGAILAPFIRRVLRRADVIVAATEGHIRSSAFLPRYADKCRIIPYGLDFSQYPQPGDVTFLDRRLRDKRSKKLLFVGRLVYYKGVDVLIRAMKDAAAHTPGCELFIVGDGPLESSLKEFAAQSGLSDCVHFLGTLPRDKLLAAFAGCDIFVLPSVAKSEAFGIVQLEAMYYGKPVINTDLPTGVPCVSVDGETGLTVKAGDADELAGAIGRLVKDGELRRVYGENAARRVRERFSIDDMLDAVYELYQEVMVK